jgi:hypothetical protein
MLTQLSGNLKTRTPAMPTLPTVEVVIDGNGYRCYQVELAGLIFRRGNRWQVELLLEQYRADALPSDWYAKPLGRRSIVNDTDTEPDPGV